MLDAQTRNFYVRNIKFLLLLCFSYTVFKLKAFTFSEVRIKKKDCLKGVDYNSVSFKSVKFLFICIWFRLLCFCAYSFHM